jgi:hypothetical protein
VQALQTEAVIVGHAWSGEADKEGRVQVCRWPANRANSNSRKPVTCQQVLKTSMQGQPARVTV